MTSRLSSVHNILASFYKQQDFLLHLLFLILFQLLPNSVMEGDLSNYYPTGSGAPPGSSILAPFFVSNINLRHAYMQQHISTFADDTTSLVVHKSSYEASRYLREFIPQLVEPVENHVQ